jgi:hypothetical protein
VVARRTGAAGVAGLDRPPLGEVAGARIHVSVDEEPSFYAKTAYRMPAEATAPGATPTATVPITENGVKAVIARPLAGARRAGLAWRPRGRRGRLLGPHDVAQVEVSGDDGGTWQLATLEGDDTPGAWRVFRATLPIDGPGPRTIAARATDARGAVQPTRPRCGTRPGTCGTPSTA